MARMIADRTSPSLGFGIMRLPSSGQVVDMGASRRLFDIYMSADCEHYFDTHPHYMFGRSEAIFRQLIAERFPRDSYLVAAKIPYTIKEREDYQRYLTGSLDALGVDHINYYMLHALSDDVYDMHIRLGGFDFLRRTKERGLARNIGFSFHGSPALLDMILTEQPDIDFVQLQINYADWDSPAIASRACYETAVKHGKPIIVMEPIKGGGLVNIKDAAKKLCVEHDVTPAEAALSFVKSLSGIRFVLSGMSTAGQVEDNIRIFSPSFGKRLSGDVYVRLADLVNGERAVACTGCGYCERECPKGIAISKLMSLLNMTIDVGSNDKTFYGRYKIFYDSYLTPENNGKNCIRCGLCEIRCPQHLDIRKHIERAVFLAMAHHYTDEKNVLMLIALMKKYGIKRVIASPGTTNIALVGSIQGDPDFEMLSCVDERSAAYMACGIAADTGEPVVITCTGATASRNYLPALTEAHYRHLPVLAVTFTQGQARVGHDIAQVIDRSSRPNDVARFSGYLGSADTPEDEWAATITINKALSELTRGEGGPVHLDVSTTYSRNFTTIELPDVRKIERVERSASLPKMPGGRIAIFVGAHKRFSEELTRSIEKFCEAHDAIVICDRTSNYFGAHRVTPSILASQDEYRSKELSMDLLIHIGDVSGAYLNLSPKEVWRVAQDGEMRDTFRKLTKVFEMSELEFFKRMDTELREDKEEKYHKAITAECEKLRAHIPDMPFSNIWIAQQLSSALPKNATLHLGILNSLRSWNFFDDDNDIECFCNVGGFGIDGCLSSMIGASIVSPDKIYYGVIGDLAFFYDMNALGNRHVGKNLRLLIINNGKGTEFRNYNHPGAIFGDAAEDYIAAGGHFGDRSQELVRHYAQDLGFEYISAANKDEFEQNRKIFLDERADRSIVFEVFIDSQDESDALYAMRNIVYEDISEKKLVELFGPYEKIGLYAVMDRTRKILDVCMSSEKLKDKRYFLYDGDKNKHGTKEHGITISPPEMLGEDQPDIVVICNLVRYVAIRGTVERYVDRNKIAREDSLQSIRDDRSEY